MVVDYQRSLTCRAGRSTVPPFGDGLRLVTALLRAMRIVADVPNEYMGLTMSAPSATIPAVKPTRLSAEMCMPWRPRRVEDGV